MGSKRRYRQTSKPPVPRAVLDRYAVSPWRTMQRVGGDSPPLGKSENFRDPSLENGNPAGVSQGFSLKTRTLVGGSF